MRRDELQELHYIAPIETVPSIVQHGLLSHRRAAAFSHTSVAMEEVQERRRTVILPSGRQLHEHVNMYLHARNPMMFKLHDLHLSLCVFRISTNVLDLSGAMVADRNASTGMARFYPSPEGLAYLDRDKVFAEDWRHPGDKVAYWNHKAIKCAEILVPDRIDTSHIMGAYVSCEQTRRSLALVAPDLPIVIDGHLFFRPGGG